MEKQKIREQRRIEKIEKRQQKLDKGQGKIC